MKIVCGTIWLDFFIEVIKATIQKQPYYSRLFLFLLKLLDYYGNKLK